MTFLSLSVYTGFTVQFYLFKIRSGMTRLELVILLSICKFIVVLNSSRSIQMTLIKVRIENIELDISK